MPYQLSDGEKDLYDKVTHYVREEMNRAERLGTDNPAPAPSASPSPSCNAGWHQAPPQSCAPSATA